MPLVILIDVFTARRYAYARYLLRGNVCTSVQISNITKVCVQNALRVLECKLEDMDATA